MRHQSTAAAAHAEKINISGLAVCFARMRWHPAVNPGVLIILTRLQMWHHTVHRAGSLITACDLLRGSENCAGAAPQAGRGESFSEEGPDAALGAPKEDAQVASSGCKQS